MGAASAAMAGGAPDGATRTLASRARSQLRRDLLSALGSLEGQTPSPAPGALTPVGGGGGAEAGGDAGEGGAEGAPAEVRATIGTGAAAADMAQVAGAARGGGTARTAISTPRATVAAAAAAAALSGIAGDGHGATVVPTVAGGLPIPPLLPPLNDVGFDGKFVAALLPSGGVLAGAAKVTETAKFECVASWYAREPVP